MNNTTKEFWEKFISDNYDLLKKAVHKKIFDDQEAYEEALSFVSEKLVEDNMRRLMLYDPQKGASPKTYFNALIRFLICRFFEKKNKKLFFPKWLKEQNNFLWILVYKFLCWYKWSEKDTIEYLKVSNTYKRSTKILNEAIDLVRFKYPDCGKSKENKSLPEDEQFADPDNTTPEKEIIRFERIKILLEIVSDNSETSCKNNSHINLLRDNIRKNFNPSTQQRLLLKMIYQDGLSVAAAGKKLGWNKNQASGQNRRLLQKLRIILGDSLKDHLI